MNEMSGFSGRRGNVLWLSLCALGLLAAVYSWPANAQVLSPLPSTPDLTISGDSTSVVAVPFGRADWVFIQNNCSNDIAFDLNPRADGDVSATSYPLRLPQDGQFQARIRIHSLGASAIASTACTYTVLFAR